MLTWSSVVDAKVDAAVDAYERRQVGLSSRVLPINLGVLVDCVGNIELEEREMIPEAAMEPTGSHFRLYLRSNFKERPGQRLRQRFSLAHELAHTFFYEIRDGGLKPIRGAPRGLDMETACHETASRILAPDRLLMQEIGQDLRLFGEDVLRLAATFDVSLEVILRRLRNHTSVQDGGPCFALCRRGKLEYAMYPPWLATVLGKPAESSVQSWFRSSEVSLQGWFYASGLKVEELSNGCCIGTGDGATISARRLSYAVSADLFELTRHGPSMPIEELRLRLGEDETGGATNIDE
jgi:hypothetical protein